MRYLQLQGFKVYKISDRFRSGIPDLYAVRRGQHYWLEVKDEKGRVSKIQEYELSQLQDHGATARVVRSVADVRGVISA
jgi:Holliday junction resolvase